MATAKTAKAQRGVSLLEALLATSIAGVLTTAAVPAMTEAMSNQRLGTGTSDLFASFNLARSEAVRRGEPVAVAPPMRRTGRALEGLCDRNDDGAQNPGEETLVERPPIAAGLAIQPVFGATYSGKVLSYSSEGRLHRPGKNLLVIGRLVITTTDSPLALLRHARRAHYCVGDVRLRSRTNSMSIVRGSRDEEGAGSSFHPPRSRRRVQVRTCLRTHGRTVILLLSDG